MNNNKAYIKIADEDDINFQPSDEQIMLDNEADLDYTTPYTDNYDDIINGIGDVIEAGDMFDGR